MIHSHVDGPGRTGDEVATIDDLEARDSRRWAEAVPFSGRRELRLGERIEWRRRGWQLLITTIGATAAGCVLVGGGAQWLDRGAPALAHAFGGVPGLALALLGIVGVLGVCLAPSRPGDQPAMRTKLWTRAGLLAALLLTVGATAWAPADALSSLWLRTPWVAIVLLGTGSLALATWQRIALLGRLPRLFADLRTGTVDVYCGPNGANRLEVMPRSHVVLGRNGSATRGLELTRTAEIAAPQPHAYRTSLPHGIVRASADAHMRLQRRGLTIDERAELGAHIQRLRRAAWPALGSVFAVAVVLGVRMFADPDWHNLVDVVALGWYTLGVVACVGYARRFRAARKLEIDRDLRWVVTVDDASPCASGIARLEVLPVSHLAWTEDAAPAQWRLHGA